MKQLFDIIYLFIIKMVYLEKKAYRLGVAESRYALKMVNSFIDSLLDYRNYINGSMDSLALEAALLADANDRKSMALELSYDSEAPKYKQMISIGLLDPIGRSLDKCRALYDGLEIKLGATNDDVAKAENLDAIDQLLKALVMLGSYFSAVNSVDLGRPIDENEKIVLNDAGIDNIK